MNKKRIAIILAVCCVLAAAFILGATGAIDLTKEQETKPGDRLIGVIVTTDYLFPEPSFIPGQGLVFSPAKGVLADRNDAFSYDTLPKEYDFSFPGVEGVRLFNVDTPPFDDGHTQVNTRAADKEFCRVSIGTHQNSSKHNGSENSSETIYEISGTLKYALPDDEVTFFSTPIYLTAEGEAYLGNCGSGFTLHKDQWNRTSATFSDSSSDSKTHNGETTVEGRSIKVTVQLVRQPVKITLCQFNAAHELLQADEYLPEEMPHKITPLRETAMILVDTENKPDDGHESHTYESYSRDDTSFYTLQYKENGYCIENYHDLLWPHLDEATDFAWKVENGTLTISGHGRMPDFQRNPSTVDADGYTVIGTAATPWQHEQFTRVIIEEGITYLGSLAFESNQITDIVLPESLISIPSHSFQTCEGLTEIRIPDSITEIEPYTFNSCRNLKKAILPNSITIIGSHAFCYCTRLTEVNLPDSVTTIENCAFKQCVNLEYITLPASVQTIGDDAFAECGNLKSITVAEGSYAEQYCIDNKLPYDYGDGTPVHMPAPDNPSISWKVENDTLFISGTGAMDDYRQRYKTSGPEDTKGFYGTNAPWDDESFSRVVIEEGITSIGELTFSNRYGLYSVTLPKSLKTIEKNAFFFCNDLEEINLDSVTTILEGALIGCHCLRSVALPSSLETIEPMVFRACTNLTEIRVPDSVKAIRSWAFSNCISLEKVFLPASVTEISKDIFDGCKNLKEILVEKGSYAEQYCIDNKLPYTLSE